jgi:hypothetical protein
MDPNSFTHQSRSLTLWTVLNPYRQHFCIRGGESTGSKPGIIPMFEFKMFNRCLNFSLSDESEISSPMVGSVGGFRRLSSESDTTGNG